MRRNGTRYTCFASRTDNDTHWSDINGQQIHQAEGFKWITQYRTESKVESFKLVEDDSLCAKAVDSS